MTIETPTRVDDASETPDPSRIIGYDFVDPHTLLFEENVRADTGDISDLDPDFIASIGEYGVTQPIVVRRRASDERLVVRTGKGRTRAARHVGRWVDVVIEREPAPETDDVREEQIARIVAQLAENQHRTVITDADEVRAHGQLMLTWEMSPDEIATATHSDPERVRRTTKVAASSTAMDMLSQLDLGHLEVIAELDGDDTAVAELVKVALNQPTQFAHVAQRLRRARQLADARARKSEELADVGCTVVDDPTQRDGAMQLCQLRARPEDPQNSPCLTDEEHAGCPGHAVSVDAFRHGIRDEIEVDVLSWCLDPTSHGHVPVWAPSTAGTDDEPDEDRPPSFGGTPLGGGSVDPTSRDGAVNLDDVTSGADGDERSESDADDPAVAQRAVDLLEAEKRAEEQRVAAERARRYDEAMQRFEVELIRNRTEAARAAQTVRQEWVSGLLHRKAPPKAAASYVAEHLVRWEGDFDNAAADGHDLACELLGMRAPELDDANDGLVSRDLLAATRSATAGRATVLTLALVLAAQERALTHQAWRHHTAVAGPYLRGLQQWGYTVSPIEQIMIDPDSEIAIDGDPNPPAHPDTEEPDGAEPEREPDADVA